MLTSRTKILNKINGKEKGKACQNKLNSFSTVEKRQKIDENLVKEVQWPIPNLLKSTNPNTENKKKTLIMRKQLSFRGLRKNRRITVTYWPSEERTLNSQLQVFMKAYSGIQTLLKIIISQKTPWTSQNSRENTAMWNRTLLWRSLFHPVFGFIIWIVIQTPYYDSHLDSSDFQCYKKLPSYWVIRAIYTRKNKTRLM